MNTTDKIFLRKVDFVIVKYIIAKIILANKKFLSTLTRMAKKNRILVLLTNEESGYSYVRWVDPRKNQTKLAFKKFDPYLRKHALFKQKKLVNS